MEWDGIVDISTNDHGNEIHRRGLIGRFGNEQSFIILTRNDELDPWCRTAWLTLLLLLLSILSLLFLLVIILLIGCGRCGV